MAVFSVLLLVAVAAYEGYATLHARTMASSYLAPADSTTTPAPGASWQQEMMLLGLATSTAPGENDGSDPVAMITPEVLGQLIGQYNGLRASGQYSSSTAAAAAASIAPDVYANVPYKTYAATSIKTDPNSSYDRMLAYRTDMQTALAPLLENKQAEYAIYGSYVATGDASYLRALQADANNYTLAATNAAAITVPADIVSTHLTIVNALSRFSATLTMMTTHADDPLASVALLRTYNDAEAAVVNSFDTLAQYERLKTP